MAAGVSDGANSRPLDDTIAETGPGLSDDAVLDGELAPGELGSGAETMIAGLRKKGWTAEAARDGGDQEEGEDGEGI